MSDRPDRPRSRRGLSKEDRDLWRAVLREVKPLRGRRRHEEEPAGEPEPPSVPAVPRKHPSPSAPQTPAKPKSAPPLAPLGRRMRQRVARGTAEIDARLDLHGMTQERAHRALTRFLRAAQADGAQLVLVITGKGARTAGDAMSERGVLRRAVPQWLALPEFRGLIIGFETAAIGHGGEGAFYVRVRRGR